MKSKKHFFSIAIAFTILLFSCETHNENDLELTILSKSVNCVPDLQPHLLDSRNPEYDTFYEKKSFNVVDYKIHNTSNKKYFIVLNPENFESMRYTIDKKNKLPYTNSLNLYMYDNGKKIHGYAMQTFISNEDTLVYKNKLYNRKVRTKKNEKMYNVKDWIQSESLESVKSNSIIIYPNETKYFSTLVNLPLANYISESNPWMIDLDSRKKYSMALTLYNNDKFTSDHLTDNLKKEIKENGYVLFDGEIKSNMIPVNFIQIKSLE